MKRASLPRRLKMGLAAFLPTLALILPSSLSAQQTKSASARPSPAASTQHQFVARYCTTCHNERLKSGALNLAKRTCPALVRNPNYGRR
jgi:hypothetical protein